MQEDDGVQVVLGCTLPAGVDVELSWVEAMRSYIGTVQGTGYNTALPVLAGKW
jgi:hypothetical protein